MNVRSLPTGLMKPTLSKRFCKPESRAKDVDVFPTCCFVAATKIGRWRRCLFGGLVDSVLNKPAFVLRKLFLDAKVL